MPETAKQEVHLPSTVGSTFMRQYYHFLAKEPASLHRFYKDESTWCHGVGSHMQEAISGQKAINDAIISRGYAGARVDLDIGSIDCQASLHGGVFVLVTGVMTLASSPVPKPFVQTFFLAVQPKGYFVLNDCLRFLELPGAAPSATDAAVTPTDAKKQPAQAAIGTPVAAASPAAKSKPVTPVAAAKKEKAPASPVAKPVESPASPVKAKSPEKVASPKAAPAPAPAAPASPVKKAAPTEAKTTPKPSETKPATPASPAAPAKPAEPVAAPADPKPVAAAPAKPAEPAAPPAPKTWAALFSAATAAAPAAAPAAPKAPVAKPAPAPASPAETAEPKAAKPTEAAAAAPQEKEKKRYFSLYIRDIPPQTKDTDLRELFKPYGAIAGVTVPQGRGFAFVDFFEEESMRAALAVDEHKVFDKVIKVDERKDRERSGFRQDSRGGRGGRGAPKSGRTGDRKDREDRPTGDREATNGKGPAASNGPRAANNGDRRDKGGRRSGKEEGGHGN